MSDTRTSTRPDEPADERTVALARRRFTRRQWARRLLAWRGGLLALLVTVGVGFVCWLFLFSSALAVSAVRVDGVRVLTAQQVRQAAAVPLGEPLATVDLHAIATRVRTLPAVRSVDVVRSWPDKVRIAVRERVAVAVVERGGGWHGLDSHGVLFRTYSSRPARLPVVRTGRHTPTDALAEVARVAHALPAGLAARVDFVEVHSVDTITLHLAHGRTVLWGSADASAQKAKVLGVLLERLPHLRHKPTFYDLSVPGQPILRR
ncbi:MAG: cell division protein FtsQ/DivIB [Nocardioidaceae bacterium]